MLLVEGLKVGRRETMYPMCGNLEPVALEFAGYSHEKCGHCSLRQRDEEEDRRGDIPMKNPGHPEASARLSL